jgi:hypothetical protein
MPGGNRDMGTTFQTSDSVDKVVAWYKDKLSGKSGFKQQSMQMPSEGQTQDSGTASAPTVFTFTSGSTTKMVMIRSDNTTQGGTYITIRDGSSDMPTGAPPDGQTNQMTPSNQTI